MKTATVVTIAVTALGGALLAQETKPVPKDSMRVYVTGCTKGMIFTAGPRTEDPPSSLEIRAGMHLRMNGPKKLMAEIKAHEGTVIGITGSYGKTSVKHVLGHVLETAGPTLITPGSVNTAMGIARIIR